MLALILFCCETALSVSLLSLYEFPLNITCLMVIVQPVPGQSAVRLER